VDHTTTACLPVAYLIEEKIANIKKLTTLLPKIIDAIKYFFITFKAKKLRFGSCSKKLTTDLDS